MKAKRPVGRRWRRAFSGLLLLTIGVLALFRASQIYCAIPDEIRLSEDFHWSLVTSDRTEATLLRMLHSEMSKELAFLGTIDSLEYEFRYGCQSDSCVFYRAIVSMHIAYFPECARKNDVSSHVFTAYTSFSNSYIEPPRKSSRTTEHAWDEIASDFSLVKRYALESVENFAWKPPQEFALTVSRRLGQWFIVFNGPNDYSSSVRLENSDIQRIKEEKQ